MASVCAWLSITVKQGLKVLQKPRILKCNWENSFGEVLGQANREFIGKTVLKILISDCVTFSSAQEETLINDSETVELKKQFAIVRPICFLCRSRGKRPTTRQPNLVAKKKKS